MSMLVLPYRCHDCRLRFFQFRWRKVATLWRQPSGTRGWPASVRGGAPTQNPALGQQTTPASAAMIQGSPLAEPAARRTAATALRTAYSPAGLVLGVSERATSEEVSAAYRRLAQLYHPDKVAGLAPELQALAEERMKEINAAYAVLKQRG